MRGKEEKKTNVFKIYEGKGGIKRKKNDAHGHSAEEKGKEGCLTVKKLLKRGGLPPAKEKRPVTYSRRREEKIWSLLYKKKRAVSNNRGPWKAREIPNRKKKQLPYW